MKISKIYRFSEISTIETDLEPFEMNLLRFSHNTTSQDLSTKLFQYWICLPCFEQSKMGRHSNVLMPCPTGPKMFWAGPNILCQTKN